MATYKQIIRFVKTNYDLTVKTCWIAHVKELNGLPVRRASNRSPGNDHNNPCPPDKQPLIEEAMRHYDMIP